MTLMRCDQCLVDKPMEQFPNLSLGLVCNACLSGEKAARAETALKAKAQQIAGQLIASKPEDLAANIGGVKSILSDLYREFGGTSGYAAHLHYIIMELSARRPMPAAVGQLMVNLMKLHHTVEQTEESINAREMTDDQLRREHDLAMMRIAMEAIGDPEKRKALEAMLRREGLVLSEASGTKLIDDMVEDAAAKVTHGSDIPTDEMLREFLG